MWDPNYIAAIVKDRDPRLGACADTGHWARSGLKPVECLRILKGRVISSHMKDLNRMGEGAHDVPLRYGGKRHHGLPRRVELARFRGEHLDRVRIRLGGQRPGGCPVYRLRARLWRVKSDRGRRRPTRPGAGRPRSWSGRQARSRPHATPTDRPSWWTDRVEPGVNGGRWAYRTSRSAPRRSGGAG